MLELEFRYDTFMQIQVMHNYFVDNSMTDFQLTPTANTEKLMCKIGFIAKNTAEGIHLLYDVQKLEAFYLFLQAEEPFKFSFYLQSSQTYFYNFTNLPIESRSWMLYFNNEKVALQTEGNLHPSSFVSEAELYMVKPSIFEMRSAPKTQITLLDDSKQKVLEVINESESFLFNLQNFPTGKYILLENGQMKESFVYLPNMMPPLPLALIEITLDNTTRKALVQQIKENEPLTPRKYKICFETRHTFWRYFIVPKYQNGLQNLVIDTNDQTISFTGPEKCTLPNGIEAYKFESKQALPLNQISQYNFQLIKNKDSKGKSIHMVMRRLPTPSFEILKPESRKKDSKVYSEIIIYI